MTYCFRIARMKLAEDMQCKEDKKHSIIHNINSYKEELRALIQAKEDIEVIERMIVSWVLVLSRLH